MTALELRARARDAPPALSAAGKYTYDHQGWQQFTADLQRMGHNCLAYLADECSEEDEECKATARQLLAEVEELCKARWLQAVQKVYDEKLIGRA